MVLPSYIILLTSYSGKSHVSSEYRASPSPGGKKQNKTREKKKNKRQETLFAFSFSICFLEMQDRYLI